VQAGKIDLDRDVNDYLDQAPRRNARRSAGVRWLRSAIVRSKARRVHRVAALDYGSEKWPRKYRLAGPVVRGTSLRGFGDELFLARAISVSCVGNHKLMLQCTVAREAMGGGKEAQRKVSSPWLGQS
jgi:hypothetical protein